MIQKFCGTCKHGRRLPEQPLEDSSISCFHSPPGIVAVPVMVPPSVRNPQGGQATQMSVMFPRVVPNFPACGQYAAPVVEH